MIAVVDYGVGNLYSLTCSLRHIGAQCTVTREENMRRLARNGVLVYLTRPLEAFATEERPLSAGGVAALYEARRPLYEAYADITVANDGDPAETARAVLARVQNRKEAP